MDSEIGYSQTQQYCHQNNSGLSRYGSSPSSLLTSNGNHQHQNQYSPSTSSEMETMFLNSQHLQVKLEENDSFSQGLQYNGYSYYESPNQMIYQTHQNHGTMNFSSRQSSCSFNMPQIVENHQHEPLQQNCTKSKDIGKFYMPSFTSDYWDSSTFNAPKASTMNGEIIFSTSNALAIQVHKTKLCEFLY